jgi:hypothetical protein
VNHRYVAAAVVELIAVPRSFADVDAVGVDVGNAAVVAAAAADAEA